MVWFSGQELKQLISVKKNLKNFLKRLYYHWLGYKNSFKLIYLVTVGKATHNDLKRPQHQSGQVKKTLSFQSPIPLIMRQIKRNGYQQQHLRVRSSDIAICAKFYFGNMQFSKLLLLFELFWVLLTAAEIYIIFVWEPNEIVQACWHKISRTSFPPLYVPYHDFAWNGLMCSYGIFTCIH